MAKEHTSKLEMLNQEIAKLSLEKNERTELARKFDRKCKGKEGFEGRMRKMQQKLDETLIRLTKYELDAVKIQEQLNVDPQMRQELTEDRIHLKQRANETGERIEKHKRRTQIPWEVYEEALKDTKEKANLEKRLEELRKRGVFTRG